MLDLSSPENPGLDSHHRIRRVSFGRLQEVGAAALLPARDGGIGSVFLVVMKHRWYNAYNLETICRADDLLEASARFPEICQLFPKGAELLALTFEFIFANCAEPCRVVLERPDKLLVQNPDFAERIETFLVRCGLVEILRAAASAAPTLDSRAHGS